MSQVWLLVYEDTFWRQMRRLERGAGALVVDRVLAALEKLRAAGPSGFRGLDVARLHGYSEPTYRLRVGRYRVFFRIDHEKREITVAQVASREQAYR